MEKKLFKSFAKHENRVSHETLQYPYSGKYLVRLFFIKHPHTWHTKEDVMSFLEKNGKKLKVKSLYNVFYKLKRIDFLESRHSSFAEYHLKQLKSETDSMAISSRVWRLDFFDYLETLNWEDVSRVHDVRFYVSVDSLRFVSGWEHYERRKLFQKVVEVEGLRFVLQARYGKGKSLLVIVSCANDPIAYGLEGLTSLYDAVSKVRSLYCNSEDVPFVGEWKVVQWHFGRDTKGSIEGADFALSFNDWFGNLARIYARHDGKVRAERVENPNIKFKRLLERESKKKEHEISRVQGMVLSMFQSCVHEYKANPKKFIDLENITERVLGKE